ncbi:MAG TPA: hypothetical protein VGP04_22405 [Pseudonocardiaceae bacterium]|nr:hypothetical protein [Pseudonocardiaceae bacterium]
MSLKYHAAKGDDVNEWQAQSHADDGYAAAVSACAGRPGHLAFASPAHGLPGPGAVRQLPLALPVSDAVGPGDEVSPMDRAGRLGGSIEDGSDYFSLT